MSKFVLEIHTDNAAFQPNPGNAVNQGLTKVQQKVEMGQRAGTLMDVNGNTVGTFRFLDDQEEAEAQSQALSKVIDAAHDALVEDQEISDRNLAFEVTERVPMSVIGEALRDLLEPVLRGTVK